MTGPAHTAWGAWFVFIIILALLIFTPAIGNLLFGNH